MVRNTGIIDYQPFPQHVPSDAVLPNLLTVPDTTPIKSANTIPTDQSKFLTSTPIKSGAATIVLPVDLSMLGMYIDMKSSSESSSSETSATIDADAFSLDNMIIEQYQILPDRVWESRYVCS